jgi:hypothetical protein
MAVHDHTGRIRPSIPLNGTLTSCSGIQRAKARAADSRACQPSPTTAIGYG